METLDQFHLELVAGEKGLNNDVKWNHVGEEPRVAEYIQGGELVSLTGFQLGNDEEKLLQYVQEIEKNGATGVIFSLGAYIKKIPDSVLKFGNEKDFPIFQTPWETWLVELNRSIGEAIIEDERAKILLEEAFRVLLFMPENYPFYRKHFKENGFVEGYSYTVAILERNEYTKGICQNIEVLAERRKCKSVRLKNEEELIFIFGSAKKENLSQTMEGLNDQCNGICLLGYSNIIDGLLNITKGYQQAKEVVQLRIHNPEISISDYNELGVYQILLSIKNQNLIHEFCQSILNPLIEYDRIHDSDLMEVLKMYFQWNESISQMAEIMSKHRNTINHKLKKIETLTGGDFCSAEFKFKIMMAFKLNQIYDER